MAAQPISMPRGPHAEIKVLIDKLLSGFNDKDYALYDSAFGDDVVIVDGIAPYRWTGRNAQARWFVDADRWAHELGVIDEKITYDRIIRADVVDSYAYFVLSATLSFRLNGQRGSRPGILTFTLAMRDNEWKIESQAWGLLG